RLQDHAVAAAKWPVVNDVMLVRGPRTQVVRLNFNQPRPARASNNPVIECFAKIIGKYRNDIDAKRCHCRLSISDYRFLSVTLSSLTMPIGKLAIANLQFQESFGRVDLNQLLIDIDIYADITDHRDQHFTAARIGHYHDLDATGAHYSKDIANHFSAHS